MKSFFTKVALLSATLFIVSSFSFAQKGKTFSGVITYDITYPDMELDPSMAGQLPTSMTVSIKDEKSKTDMQMGMMSQTVIMDKKTKKLVLLMDAMGQKIMMRQDMNDSIKGKDPQVKILSETKDIAGYKCKKAEVSDDEGNIMNVFFTDEFIDSESTIKGINGVLMEYEQNQGQIKMKMTAKSVEKKKIKDTEFLVPSDYKEYSQEELQKLFGGAGEE